jgi:RNA polymerase sigma-70 factor (ECF subfamily)
VSTDVNAAVDTAFREEWGRVVATLIRTTGDWDLAEECAQDAFAMALQRWPRDGIPGRPGAWLTTAARNRAIDVLRRKAVGAAKLREVAVMSPGPGAYEGETDHSGVPDDRLRLMFTCCHPALSLEARVALTLRTLAGLTTAEIARAFLASEPTMAKRLVRAKQKIQNAGIPHRVPPAHLLPERTPGVLGVLYLLFNEGYSATAGADLVRQNLSAEAIRLARVLARLPGPTWSRPSAPNWRRSSPGCPRRNGTSRRSARAGGCGRSWRTSPCRSGTRAAGSRSSWRDRGAGSTPWPTGAPGATRPSCRPAN